MEEASKHLRKISEYIESDREKSVSPVPPPSDKIRDSVQSLKIAGQKLPVVKSILTKMLVL